MTIYLTDKGESYALCREAEPTVNGKWVLHFDGAGNGFLYVNARPHTLCAGTVLLPEEALREGENTLVCVTPDGRYPVEPLCRAGAVIFPKAPDTTLLCLRLAEQQEKLTGAVRAAEARLAALEKQAAGYTLLP